MTFRVVYTPEGHPFPRWRDFADLGDAKVYRRRMAVHDPEAEIERLGAGGKAAVEPGNGPLSDSDRAKVPQGHQDGDSAANRRTAIQGDE